MAIEKWNPIGDLIAIQDRLNNLLKDALNTSSLANDRQSVGWSPAADFFETKDAFVAVLELPGLKSADLDINIEGNTLTISAGREAGKKVKKRNYFRQECSRESFTRSFTLPAVVLASKVRAELKDGVLEVFLPKTTAKASESLKVKVQRSHQTP